jgi:hypothetical protein
MLQHGATFLKYTSDGKRQYSRRLWLTDDGGKLTVRWIDTNPNLCLADISKTCGKNQSLRLTEVKRIVTHEEMVINSGSGRLVIKLQDRTQDMTLELDDEQLFSRWLEAFQAAHHVSHCTKRIQQGTRRANSLRDRYSYRVRGIEKSAKKTFLASLLGD